MYTVAIHSVRYRYVLADRKAQDYGGKGHIWTRGTVKQI